MSESTMANDRLLTEPAQFQALSVDFLRKLWRDMDLVLSNKAGPLRLIRRIEQALPPETVRELHELEGPWLPSLVLVSGGDGKLSLALDPFVHPASRRKQ